MAASNANAVAIRRLYKELLVFTKTDSKKLSELRSTFRKPLQTNETIDQKLQKGRDRLSFLKITSVKAKSSSQSGGRWVYKDGKRLEQVGGTLRDAAGRVVSSFDGKNLDPEAISRHQKGLKRAGFINNSHAKGLF